MREVADTHGSRSHCCGYDRLPSKYPASSCLTSSVKEPTSRTATATTTTTTKTTTTAATLLILEYRTDMSAPLLDLPGLF